MMLRRRVVVAGAWSLVIPFILLALAGCSSSPEDTSTTGSAVPPISSAASTTTSVAPTGVSAASTTTSAVSTTSSLAPVSPAERKAAEVYLAAMAPVIDKDYEGSQWFQQLGDEWMKNYGNGSLSTNRKAWNALGLIFQEALAKEQEIIQGYEAITPPDVFRAAHTALLENNRQGNAWAAKVVAAIQANRPIGELMSMVSAGPPGPSNGDVLAQYRAATAQVGIEVPAKLLDVYSDDTDSGQLM